MYDTRKGCRTKGQLKSTAYKGLKKINKFSAEEVVWECKHIENKDKEHETYRC